MNVNSAILEQIVKSVVSQLTSEGGTSSQMPKGTLFDDKVLTGDTLEARLNGSRTIQIGTKTILTPSARDFLRSHGVSWTRSNGNAGVQHHPQAVKWQAFVVDGSTALEQLIAERTQEATGLWNVTHLDGTEDVAATAMKVLLEKKASGALVFHEAAELVACRANRNENIWAASARSRQDVERIRSQMNVNLWAVSSLAMSYMELRNVLRAIEK